MWGWGCEAHVCSFERFISFRNIRTHFFYSWELQVHALCTLFFCLSYVRYFSYDSRNILSFLIDLYCFVYFICTFCVIPTLVQTMIRGHWYKSSSETHDKTVTGPLDHFIPFLHLPTFPVRSSDVVRERGFFFSFFFPLHFVIHKRFFCVSFPPSNRLSFDFCISSPFFIHFYIGISWLS